MLFFVWEGMRLVTFFTFEEFRSSGTFFKSLIFYKRFDMGFEVILENIIQFWGSEMKGASWSQYQEGDVNLLEATDFGFGY